MKLYPLIATSFKSAPTVQSLRIVVTLLAFVCSALVLAPEGYGQVQSIEYTYDAAGRLLGAASQNHGAISYRYDKDGNLVEERRSALSASERCNLSLTIQNEVKTFRAGEAFSFLIVATNAGPGIAVGTSINCSIPENMHFVSAIASQGAAVFRPGNLTIYPGLIAPHQSIDIMVTVIPQSSGSWQAKVQLESPSDGSQTDNQSLKDFPIMPAVDLAVKLLAPPAPIVQGALVITRFEISNRIPGPVPAASIAYSFAESFNVLAVAVSRGTYSMENGRIVWQAGDIPSGEKAVITIKARPSAAGLVESTAKASSDLPDIDPRNNEIRFNAEVLAPTVVVVNTASNGPGSLREALIFAENNPGLDVITFDIPGAGIPRIEPVKESIFPEITEPLVLDASTQPAGMIEISGINAGTGAIGLKLDGGLCVVRNLIVNRFYNGFQIRYKGGNVIQGCYIGTDSTGLTAVANTSSGIIIYTSPGNLIGGSIPEARNVISGNKREGIRIFGDSAYANEIQGNYIGVDATGGKSLRNEGSGISLSSSHCVVGGSDPRCGNVISGNFAQGILMASADSYGNTLMGNIIGLDAGGNTPIPNNIGIDIYNGSSHHIIGGSRPGEGNIISGNKNDGIDIMNCSYAVVQGNVIGLDASANVAVPNRGGIWVGGSSNIHIGGADAGAGNIISGNSGGVGIFIGSSSGATKNIRVYGNIIGADASGKIPLGNSTGISISQTCISNFIGGILPGQANLISDNLSYGISITSSNVVGNYIVGNNIFRNLKSGVYLKAGQSNLVSANSIYANGLLGIQTSTNATIVPNDPLDEDSGPNGQQNHPILTQYDPISSVLSGKLDSLPNADFIIEIFGNKEADESGYGEGESFLSSVQVRSGADGQCIFETVLPLWNDAFKYLSATATRLGGDSSEFGPVLKVTGPVDNDVDGIADSIESAGPNGGDANRDGIADASQPYVSTLPFDEGQYACLVVSSNYTFKRVSAVTQLTSPPGISFPIGFLSFEVSGFAQSASVPVDIFFSQGTDANAYHEYGSTLEVAQPHWFAFLFDGSRGATLQSSHVRIVFVDGASGDLDLKADGAILSVGGPSCVARSRLTGARHLGNGAIRFDIESVAGHFHQLMASTNLIDWSVLFSTNAPSEKFEIVDPDAPQFRRRFYRALTIPQ